MRHRSYEKFLLAFVVFVSLTVAAAPPTFAAAKSVGIHGADTLPAASGRNLAEILADSPDLSTFTLALKATGLFNLLRTKGPFTVFAPTNEAFDKLPPGYLNDLLTHRTRMRDLLLYHIAFGRIFTETAVELGIAKSLGGEMLSFSRQGIDMMVNSAPIDRVDIQADNGLINKIGDVLALPDVEHPRPSEPGPESKTSASPPPAKSP